MAHFAKRHYEAIAQTMQEQHPSRVNIPDDTERLIQWTNMVHALADTFRADNSLFNRSRFIHACLPGSNVKARTAHLNA